MKHHPKSKASLHQLVNESIENKALITTKVLLQDEDQPITFGERVADAVAAFGGSWKFIILFFLFLIVWILANAIVLMNRSFDPYPFILLNLILSCIAAMQAPVIMMSQNRQEQKDRIRSQNDYLINLKAEVEIRALHEKVDRLTKLLENSKTGEL